MVVSKRRNMASDIVRQHVRIDEANMVDIGSRVVQCVENARVKAPCCQTASSSETSQPLDDVRTVTLAAASSWRSVAASTAC
jgi:hypothetical protein